MTLFTPKSGRASFGALVVCWMTILVWSPESMAQGAYPSPQLQPSHGGPRGLAVGDLDDDGNLDIVVAASLTGRILIHQGLGDGTFAVGRNLQVGGVPVAVAVADFDQDGLDDAIFVDELEGNVGVLLQRPTFPVSYDAQSRRGADEPRDLLVTDLDGDLYPEIAVAQGGADQIAIFENLQGVLGAARVVELGDGPFRLERLPQLGTSRLLALHEGFLSRSLMTVDLPSSAPVARVDFVEPADLLILDHDDDGQADVEVLDASSGTVRVLSTADGTSFATIDTWAVEVGSRVLADLGGAPGAPRYLVGDSARSSFSIYADVGAGVTKRRSWLGGQGIESLVLADFDADGARELVISLTDLDVLQISAPLGEGFLAHETVYTGRTPSRIVRRPGAGTAFSILCTGSNEVLTYDLVGQELVLRDRVAVDVDAIRQGWVDFDGDGREDLVTLVARLGVQIHRNLGGSFAPASTHFLDGELRDLLVFDATGTADADILVANSTLSGVVVLEGDGSTGFASVDTVTYAQRPARLRSHDLDLDGREDLVVLGVESQVALSFRRAFGLSNPTVLAIGEEPRDAGFGDFNGDAYPDIVIANAGVGTFSILNSVVQGIYSPTTVGQPSPSGAENVVVIDVDRSGQDDIVLSSPSSQYATYHLNTGLPGNPTGRFSVPQRVRVGVLPLDIARADLDGDAVEDFFVADSAGQTLNLVRSDPFALAKPVTLELSARREGRRVRVEVAGTAATSAEFQVRRRSDGGRLVPRPSSRGVWTAIDSLAGGAPEEYLLYDRRGALVGRAQAAPREDGESRLAWEILPARTVGGATEIRFRGPTDDEPSVRILDLRGRRVARLEAVAEGSGWHRVRWEGTDQRGARVARGRYYVQLEVGGRVRSVGIRAGGA